MAKRSGRAARSWRRSSIRSRWASCARPEALLDATPEDGDPAVAEALAKAKAELDKVSGLWPGVMPPATVEGDASQLHGAAANIEIAALKLE